MTTKCTVDSPSFRGKFWGSASSCSWRLESGTCFLGIMTLEQEGEFPILGKKEGRVPAGPGAVTVAKEQLVAMNSLQGWETARAVCSSGTVLPSTVFSNVSF